MSNLHKFQVGLVGTGYAAKARAATLATDERSRLVAVTGHDPTRRQEFAEEFSVEAISNWRDLVQRSDLDLVIISTINRDHGAIARAALEAGKHVVVEYPLALGVAEATELVSLAQQQQRLLHVEHIELLSGIHLAAQAALSEIGNPFYVRYANLNPQRPAPPKWTYDSELFGFPLIGALSRIHRLTDLFGPVKTVYCQARFWGQSGLPSPYTACLCSAQLRFASGLIADLSYGKGDALWQAERTLTIHGEQGAIAIDGSEGTLILDGETRALDMGSRRGLFAKDTAMVLDHLLHQAPLYVNVESSLYALKVAEAAQQSAHQGRVIEVE
jgi:biliverdin reductase